MLHDPTLQLVFAATPKPAPPPDWLLALGRLFAALAPYVQWVFWAGLALVAGFILFFVGRELIRLRWPGFARKKKSRPAVVDWRPSEARARALLEDADRLAAEGRFDEAVRVLLFRSIEDIEGRRPQLLTPALTSRDIAGLESLPERARGAFSGIAAAVERSFFGGRPLDAEGFARCRADYEAFAFPEAWA
jgi:hypothetical protein